MIKPRVLTVLVYFLSKYLAFYVFFYLWMFLFLPIVCFLVLGLEGNVLSMYARGMGMRAIGDYIREMYAMEISATEKVTSIRG